jgi:hypothetical protein
MEPVHALLRHTAGFGKLVIWVVLIAVGVTCMVAIGAVNGVKARLGGRKASQTSQAREHPAA